MKDEIFAWRVKEGTAAEELFVQPQFDEAGRAFVEVVCLLASINCLPMSFSLDGGKEKDSACNSEGD